MTELRDDLAEQAFGVLAAAAEDGTTNWNVVAHAIVGNQLPVVERYAAWRAAEALRPVRELFAGGPDTACRTRFRWDLSVGTPTSLECVEVPMDDLRDALARAAALVADGTEPRPAHRHDETETGT